MGLLNKSRYSSAYHFKIGVMKMGLKFPQVFMPNTHIGHVLVNNLIKYLFYKSLLAKSLCYKYFIQ